MILMHQHWTERSSQGHISSIAVVYAEAYFFLKRPWHFSYGAFPPSRCAWLCTCPIPFLCYSEVQASKQKQHEEWAINTSRNWYRILVRRPVRRFMLLFYRLHLKCCLLYLVGLFPQEAINIYWHSNKDFSIIFHKSSVIRKTYAKQWWGLQQFQSSSADCRPKMSSTWFAVNTTIIPGDFK